MCEARWRILRALGFGFFVRFETQILRVELPKSPMWSDFLAMGPYRSCTPVPTCAELRRIAFLR